MRYVLKERNRQLPASISSDAFALLPASMQIYYTPSEDSDLHKAFITEEDTSLHQQQLKDNENNEL